MSELSTKDKILQTAIRLFNEHGMANVRLKQIADEVGISVGNLAYHFKNKVAIIEAVNGLLTKEASGILSTYRLFPNLMDFDNQLNKYFEFICKYPFYFSDLPEIKRQYPEFYSQNQSQISKMITQIKKRILFNQQRGIVKKELPKETCDQISKSTWVLIMSWPTQSYIFDQHTSHSTSAFKKTIWNQFYPYLTEKGIAEYNQLIQPLIQANYLS